VTAQLPNALSLLRALLAIALIPLLIDERYLAALVIVIGCAGTDWLDGYLARRLNAQSAFGAWLDPIADKLMVYITATLLWVLSWLPLWLLALMLVRDIVVVGGALLAAWKFDGFQVAPRWLGKAHVVAQFALLAGALALAAHGATATHPALLALIGVAAGLTMTSGIDYVWIWSHKARAQRWSRSD
jgi:cardiolipin synthase (CMP-forming)